MHQLAEFRRLYIPHRLDRRCGELLVKILQHGPRQVELVERMLERVELLLD
jgi:hypothetical protein